MANKVWSMTATGNLSTAGNWVPSGVPQDGDDVRFPSGSPSVTAGLTALNAATLSGSLNSLVFERGYEGTIGTADAPMQVTCDRCEFWGTGIAYLDLQASAITPQIHDTAAPNPGDRGLYLIGSALTGLVVNGGSVGLAARTGETSTVATVSAVGDAADVFLGAGCTVTDIVVYRGEHIIRCDADSLLIYGGQVTTEEAAAIETVRTLGGTLIANATGTIDDLHKQGGVIDLSQSSAPRSVGTLHMYRAGSIRLNVEAVDIGAVEWVESLALSTNAL